MYSFNILKDNKQILSYLYLFLSILGAVLPMLANFEFAREYGNSFDINNFIALANVNPAAKSISRDLLIGASAIFIWIVNESKKLKSRICGLFTLELFL